MTISIKYKTDKKLFSIWNQTQVTFFQRCMKKIKVDFLKAGQIFSNLSDELARLPTFEEFVKKYTEES